MKKSFILHIDTLAVLDELTNEQAGLLFKAIKSYQMGLNPELDFKRDAANYEKTCEKNRENGSKGGRPKKPTETEKTQAVNLKPKKADSDSDNDNNNNKRFIIPSLQEVSNYCLERGNGVDAEKFVNYYTSNGWLVGKNKMKDWKACIRTWEKSSLELPKQQKSNDQLFYENVMKQVNAYK
jgi:hypothetical protein